MESETLTWLAAWISLYLIRSCYLLIFCLHWWYSLSNLILVEIAKQAWCCILLMVSINNGAWLKQGFILIKFRSKSIWFIWNSFLLRLVMVYELRSCLILKELWSLLFLNFYFLLLLMLRSRALKLLQWILCSLVISLHLEFLLFIIFLNNLWLI